MTRKEIEAMPAGREMDVLVARHVLGCNPKLSANGKFWFCGCGYSCNYPHAAADDDSRLSGDLNFYSNNIEAAMSALGQWRGDCQLRRQNGHWRVELFKPSREWESHGETLPLAICRALLIAQESNQ